jgi:hypothetical protein
MAANTPAEMTMMITGLIDSSLAPGRQQEGTEAEVRGGGRVVNEFDTGREGLR